jgi:AcrR family transcriptional regulator
MEVQTPMAPSRRSDARPWFEVAPPTRPSLTQRDIVEAAHALVHDGGAESLTLRALGSILGVGTSAIYRRIGSKELLLVGVADLVLSEVELDGLVRATAWRSNLRTLAKRLREVLARHPHVHPVLDTYLLATPSTARVATVAIENLGHSGLATRELTDAYNAWICYVLGFSMLEFQPGTSDGDRTRASGWVEGYLERVRPDEQPAMASVRRSLRNRAVGFRWDVGPLGPRGTSFEYGMDALLDGLEARAARRQDRR